MQTPIDYDALAKQAETETATPIERRSNGTTDMPTADGARNEATATAAGYPVYTQPKTVVDYEALAKQAESEVTSQIAGARTPTTAPEDMGASGFESANTQPNPASDVLAGVAKGAGQTVGTVSNLLNKIPVIGERLAPKVGTDALSSMSQPTNTSQKIGVGAEGIAEFFLGDESLKALSIAEKLGIASKVAKLAESNPIIAKIIQHGLSSVRGGAVVTGQELAHGVRPTTALETGAVAAAAGTGIGAVTEGIAAGVPAVKKAVSTYLDKKFATKVYDEVSGKVIPVSEYNAIPRSVAGAEVQGAAKDVKDLVGAQLGAIKDEARGVTISGKPSAQFTQTLKEISSDAGKGATLQSLPSTEAGDIQKVTKELAAKDTLSHDDFDNLTTQIRHQIDRTGASKDLASQRQYIRIKDALQSEYYNQLEAAAPELTSKLQESSADYASTLNTLKKGAAANLFKTKSPENIIAGITSGSVKESAIDDVVRQLQRYEGLPNLVDKPASISPLKDFQRATMLDLYNSNATRFASGDGKVITRFDAPAALKNLEANQSVYRSLLDPEGITNNYSRFHDQLQKAASSQQNRQIVGQIAKKAAVGTATALGVGGLGYVVYKHWLESLLGL